MYRKGKMVNRKEHHDMTDRQRQRDIMPEEFLNSLQAREELEKWHRRQNQKTAITSQMALTLNGFEPKFSE